MNTLDADGWGAIWDPNGSTDIENDVKFHSSSVLGRKILSYLETHIGVLNGKRSIEIGCGSAIYSLILAKHGARITLLDYSRDALRLAERNLRLLNLDADLVQADAFNIPILYASHDIALSFGTVEHYKPPHRLAICRLHADLVRPGGVVIIETPNAAFLPHELLKRILQRSGKWAFGYEKGFSFREMKDLGNTLKLSNVRIVGSSLRSDIKHYYSIFRNSSQIRRLFPLLPSIQNTTLLQNESILDNSFARSIAILGVRSDSLY